MCIENILCVAYSERLLTMCRRMYMLESRASFLGCATDVPWPTQRGLLSVRLCNSSQATKQTYRLSWPKVQNLQRNLFHCIFFPFRLCDTLRKIILETSSVVCFFFFIYNLYIFYFLFCVYVVSLDTFQFCCTELNIRNLNGDCSFSYTVFRWVLYPPSNKAGGTELIKNFFCQDLNINSLKYVQRFIIKN